jgi:hypothetical protein
VAGECETLFPTLGDTRTAAGGGLTGDTLNPAGAARLRVLSGHVQFGAAGVVAGHVPTGVCDFIMAELLRHYPDDLQSVWPEN